MHKIEIITIEGQDTFMVNPPCGSCSSGGTCQGCEPKEKKIADTVDTFNTYYSKLGHCKHVIGDGMIFENLESIGPVTMIDGNVYSTNRLPGAYEIKEYIQSLIGR